MFILNEDYTITIRLAPGKFRTFHLEEIDFDLFIRTGEVRILFEPECPDPDDETWP